MRALIAITLTRRGVPTSRRSRRLTPHFVPKARARASASRAGASIPVFLERLERGVGGELAAADREAQAVAGHRIDEARPRRRPAAGRRHARPVGVDGQRPEHGRRR